MAVASLIVGIISIPMSCLCTLFSLPLGILAVILGFVAQSQIKQGTADGKGMATAGIICGFVSIGLAVLFLVLAIFMQMPGVMEQFR